MSDTIKNVKQLDITDNSPLHDAVRCQDIGTVIKLLAAGADVHARNSANEVPLHCAQNYTIAKLLLAAGAQVDARDEQDYTPLMYAIISRMVPVFQLLLQAGADVNAKTKKIEETPLHYAVSGMEQLNFVIIEQLLNAGAFVNTQTQEGKTPLHYFFLRVQKHNALKNDERIQKILIEYGADFQLRDNQRRAPLDYAYNLKTEQINQIAKLLR